MTDLDSQHSFSLSVQQKQLWNKQSKGVVKAMQVWLTVRVPFETFSQALQTVWSRHAVFSHAYQQQLGLKYPQQYIASGTQLFWHHQAEKSQTVDGLNDDSQHFLDDKLTVYNSVAIWCSNDKEGSLQHCLLSIPALSCDQPSMVLLVKEVNQLLQNQVLPELEADYQQFVHWQDECLDTSDEDYQAAQSQWHEVDAGHELNLAIARNSIDTDSRKDHTNTVFSHHEFTVTETFKAALNTHNADLNNALMTAVYWAFSKLTESSSVTLNQRFSCRPFEELEGLPGCLDKPISVALESFENDTFWTFLQRLQRQHEGFDSVAEYYPASQSLNKYALAEVSLLQTSSRLQAISINQWPCSYSDDLINIMCMVDDDQSVILQARFDEHLYLESEIELLLQRIESCLKQVAAEPEKSLSKLNFDLEQDHQRWKASQGLEVPVDLMPSVIKRFEHFAALTPDDIALCDTEQALNYQDLNSRVNQLAVHLVEATTADKDHYQQRDNNADIDVLVPLYLSRGADMIIAMLACLKAGCAFVPLEAGSESSVLAGQINTVLGSIDYPVIISESRYSSALPVGSHTTLLLDQLSSEPIDKKSVHSSQPHDLAYVIYTSGTTGEPKGVPVSQQNLSNYCDSLNNNIDAKKGWQWACVSTLAADLGYTAVFGALTSGGTLHILPQCVVTDERAFSDYVSSHAIDVIKMVPSHLHTLKVNLERHNAGANIQLLPSKVLILGGETFHLELNQQLQSSKQAKACRIFNHYGPSETTIGCFMGEVSENDGQAQGSMTMPIGWAMSNTEFAVIDEHGEPVASYLPGQLVVAGKGITKGYLNASDTESLRYAQRQVNGRLQLSFATGDKVRLLNDGRLEFIGRIDQQVKLRGFRIELGAIESILLRNKNISQATVIASKNNGNAPRLVAYYVDSDEQQNVDRLELHSYFYNHLAESLPDYMCPTQWINLSTLPLTRNGKIDHKKLPNADDYLSQKSLYCAPKTEMEARLAKTWVQLLAISRCGRDDHFFDVGGNSLIATQVVAQLRADLSLNIAVADLFDYPVLSDQANYLDGLLEQANSDYQYTATAVPELLAVDPAGHYPLSFSQQRLWFLDQLNPSSAFYNVPAGLRFDGCIDIQSIEDSLNILWARHDSLRTRISSNESGKVPTQWLDSAPFFLDKTDLSDYSLSDAKIRAQILFEQDALRPFSLHQDRLMRAHCIQITTDQVLLVVVLHHIISDAWSTDLLLREFAQCYLGKDIPRPAFSGLDFGEWQRLYLDDNRRTKELTFWQQQLHLAPQYLPLPIDRPRPEYQTYRGARYCASISPEQVVAIDAVARTGNYSQFMLLIAAFKLALSEWTQQSDICVTVPIAGRNQAGIERSIGLFLNTLVLRTQFDDLVTVQQLLDQLRRTALSAFDNQTLPFDQLIRELDIERATQYTPFNQVCFNLLNTPLGKSIDALNSRDLTVSLEASDTCTAKYDLEWILAPKADGGLELCVEYNRDLFNESSIGQITSLFLEWCEKLPSSLDSVWHQPETFLPEYQTTSLTHSLASYSKASVLTPAFYNNDHDSEALGRPASILSHTIETRSIELISEKLGVDQNSYLLAILVLVSGCYLDGDDNFIMMFNDAPILIEQDKQAPDANFSDLVQSIYQQSEVWQALQKTPYVIKQCRDISVSASIQVSTLEFDQTLIAHNKACCLDLMISHDQIKHKITLSLNSTSGTLSGFLSQCQHVHKQLSESDQLAQHRLADLTWLDASQQQQLINILTAPSIPFNNRATLLERLNQMTRNFGDSVAINDGSMTLSFSQLDQYSNQLAHGLLTQSNDQKKAGVKTVALLANPGAQWMIMMLAAVKAGFAYLPLDSRLPESRIQSILDDSGCGLLWFDDAHELLANSVIKSLATRGQRYHDLFAANSKQITRAPNILISQDQPLYVIYTSGSTGEPKGAVVSHENETNLINWYQQQYAINADDIVLIISALSFDLTQKNLFVALLQGATLVFPNNQTSSKVSYFDADLAVSLIEQHRVTLINCAPSSFYSMVKVCNGFERFGSLRYVLFGGEPIDIFQLSSWLSSDFCMAKLVNMYGPTECTDIACAYTIDNWTDFTDGRVIPIGHPNAGVQLYVMDSLQRILPQGLIGELVISGRGVGLGYLNNHEQTQRAFINNPLSDVDNEMYRTGDRVYVDHQGALIFCGRLDHQVKHRGFRIELGAIQRQLQLHDAIEQCAVVKATNNNGIEQLVAFYQRHSDASSSTIFAQQLNCFLAEQLPSYMLPERWVEIETIPINRNGKLDIQALAQLAQIPEHGAQDSRNHPNTDTEKWLSQLWSSLLGVESVYLGDDFFELGGHSLLATQLVSRVRRESGLSIALTIIFEHSELAALAAAIDQLGGISRDDRPVIQASSQNNTRYPLSFAQQRLWFVQSMDVNDSRYNMTSLLSISQNIDSNSLEQACLMMTQRHSVLRTRFVQDKQSEEGVCQIIDVAPKHFLQCLELKESNTKQEFFKQASTQAQELADQAFNLAESPLWRAVLISDGENINANQYVLGITLHHIAADGWSMSLLVRELAALYQHYLQTDSEQLIPLAQLSSQYSDYAQWQRELLQGAYLEKLSRYWQQHLAGAADVLNLNSDRPRPNNASFEGQRLYCELSNELTLAIKSTARVHGVTPYMLMLSAFNIALHDHTQELDLVVGTDLANRNQHEVEELIGFFVNVLPIRTKLTGNPTFTQVLQRVKTATLGVYAHQDMPFDKLVEVINPARSNAYHPLFQVLFVLQNTPQASVDQRAMSIETLPQKNDKTRFDLGLFLDDQGTHDESHIKGYWSFSNALFDRSTIDKLNRCWLSVLEVVVQHSELPLNQILSQASSSTPSIVNSSKMAGPNSLDSRRGQRRARMQRIKPSPN